MTRALKPYQEFGAGWLAEKRLALLADKMGLGKSAQAITAAKIAHCKTILVVCPAAVRFNWVNELKMWGDLEGVVLFKPSALPDICVVSYNFVTDHTEFLRQRKWDAIIIDECHFVKSIDALRSAAVYGTNGIVRAANRVWCMSGTPAPKHIAEMWILLYSFGRTKLSYEEFVKRYCDYYIYNNKMAIKGTKTEMKGELWKMIEPIALRRQVEDVLKELPPVSFSDLVIEPGEVDLEGSKSFIEYTFGESRRAELEQKLGLERKLMEDILAGKGVNPDILLSLQAAAKSLSTLHRYNGLQKIEPIAEIVSEELEAGAYEKIILFAVHRDVVEGLRSRLSKYGAVAAYGGTDPIKLQRRVDDFQNDPRTRVFVGNIQTAGTGLNLTAANQVMIIESRHNPSDIEQAWKRAHRMGQKNPVFVRFVSLNDPLDIKVTETTRKRAEELAEIFDQKSE